MKKIIFAVLFCLAVQAVAAQTHSATLTWNDTNAAGTTFNVYRATGLCTAFPTFSKIASGVAVKNYQDTTVAAGNYCFYVTAVFQAAESIPSNLAPAPIPSFTPTGLNVIPAPNSAGLTWADLLNPATPTPTYSVYRAMGLCSGTPTFSKIASGLSAKSYTDSTVTVGAYCYTVTATVNGIESSQAATLSTSIPPASPSSLTAGVQ